MKPQSISVIISFIFLACVPDTNTNEEFDRMDYRNYTAIIEKECYEISNPVSNEVEFVAVDSGFFTFGCQYNDSIKCEGSSLRHYHSGFVNSFQISSHEITVGQFRQFVEGTNYKTDAEKSGIAYVWEYVDENDQITIETPFISWKNNEKKGELKPCDDNMPVCYVSRNDCIAYCEWLSEKLGKLVRLPTREEWEYAARGGQKTKNYLYSGSDTMEVVGWCNDNSEQFIHPVKQLKSNELGLYDMSGNVWEWTSDLEGSDMGYTMGGRVHVVN